MGWRLTSEVKSEHNRKMSNQSEREPKQRKLNPWLVRGGAAVVLGTASAIGGIACNDEGGTESPTPTATVQALEYYHDPDLPIAPNINLAVSTKLVNDYYEMRGNFIPIEEIKEQALLVTLGKIEAIFFENQDLPFRYQDILRKDKKIIEIRGREFNLDRPTDFVIGVALADYLFQQYFEDEIRELDEFFDYDRQTLDNIANLFWLKDNFEVIEMGDIPPIARTANLEELAIGLKTLQEAGLPIPKKAKIGVFHFSNGTNPYESIDKDTILLDIWSYPTGEFRVGSSIAEFVIANNPQILERYSQIVTEVFNQHKDQIIDPRLLSSGDYDYVYGDDAIEFSSFFADYIFDGVGLRKKIAYAKATGHEAEAAILGAKSGYLKQTFGGRDYSVDGKTKEIREYQVGDLIKIEDYEAPRRSGIFLRPEPVEEIDPNWPSIGDGSTLKLIGKPVILLNDDRLEATTMWQVQAGSVASGRVFIPSEWKSPGWVSEEWFGEKLLTDQ